MKIKNVFFNLFLSYNDILLSTFFIDLDLGLELFGLFFLNENYIIIFCLIVFKNVIHRIITYIFFAISISLLLLLVISEDFRSFSVLCNNFSLVFDCYKYWFNLYISFSVLKFTNFFSFVFSILFLIISLVSKGFNILFFV